MLHSSEELRLVTVTLKRLTGGFYAHCPVIVQLYLDNHLETASTQTNGQGQFILRLPHWEGSISFLVRQQSFGPLSLQDITEQLDIPL